MVVDRHNGFSWTSFLYLSCAGSSSQTPKDEGRGLGQAGEILGLKRPYDVMEGGISRGLPLRDSLSTASCEGKRSFTTSGPVSYHWNVPIILPMKSFVEWHDKNIFFFRILSFKWVVIRMGVLQQISIGTPKEGPAEGSQGSNQAHTTSLTF